MTDMMEGIKDLKDVSASRRMDICKSYSSMGNMMSKVMTCKSPELKQGLMRVKMLCAAKPGSGSGVMETKIVQKKRVFVTQGISKDFTLPKYKTEKENYEGAFIDASGAVEAESTVEYTQVAAKKTGRRRLMEGTSVAKWVLAFGNDDQASAAQAKVSSKEFSEAVAKKSGVQVEAAKAEVKVVDVKVVKYVDSKPGSGSGDGKRGSGSGKPASGAAGGLRIRSPNACIELGSDVKIKRVGDGKLGFDANVHVNGAVNVKELYIGGMSIEEIVRKLVADALKNK